MRGTAPNAPARRAARRGEPACGFTLIELLLVLAIAAALAALVGLSGPPLLQGMELRSTALGWHGLMREARSQAVRDGRERVVEIDVERRLARLGNREPLGLPAGVRLHVVVAGEEVGERGAAIRFFPDGSATGGVILLSRESGAARSIHVDWLTGRTRMETPDGEQQARIRAGRDAR